MLWRSCSSSVSGYSDVSAVWEVWVWNIDGHLYKISRFLLLRWQDTYEGVFFEPVPFHSRFFRICLYPVWMLISNSAALDPLLPNFPCACSMTQRQTTQVICWKACTAGVLNTCTQSLLGRTRPAGRISMSVWHSQVGRQHFAQTQNLFEAREQLWSRENASFDRCVIVLFS